MKTNTPSIASEQLAVERKNFRLDLKENDRGRYLQITETVAAFPRSNTIVIPSSGLVEFRRKLDALIVADTTNPSTQD